MYWLLKERMGNSYGLIDDANPAPEGAEVFKTENQLERALAADQKRIESEMQALFDKPKEDNDKEPPGLQRR